MMEEQVQRVRKEMVTYLLITFVLSIPLYVLIALRGTLVLAGVGLMWLPGISALVTCLIYRQSLRGLGWGLGKVRYQILAYFVPLAYSLAAYNLVWLSGLGGITEKFTPNATTIINLLITAVIGVLASCITALGEEIGWRGFLVPRLAKITTFTKASLISGVIWAVWHYPLILFGDYRSGMFLDSRGEEAPVWFGVVCFSLLLVGISFAMGWLRLKSGSLWTATLFHAAHNVFIQGIFDPLTADTGITEYIVTEFGAALAVGGMIVGWIFWRKRAELPDTRLNLEADAA